MTEEEELAAQFQSSAPICTDRVPHARLACGGGRRRPGGVATARPQRRGQHRGPARLADHRDWPDLPGRAAQARVTGRATAGAPRRHARVGHGRRLGHHPEEQALLADSVGLALYVVMDALTAAERVSFVLHDIFDIPFDTIAAILGRSTPAAKMLASRARGRLRLGTPPAGTHPAARDVINAFLAAAGTGDIAALLTVLAPDAELRATGPREPSSSAAQARSPPRRPGSRVRTRGHTRYSWTASRAFSLPSVDDRSPSWPSRSETVPSARSAS